MYQDSTRPPLNSQPASKIQQRFADQPLSSTARSQANSKWSINIQEIVKRTQRNLERGSSQQPSSLTRTYEDKTTYQQELGFPQKSLDDVVPGKATNLYRELKQKLSVDSSTGKQVSQSTKSVLRPQSAASNSKNLLSKHLQREKGGSRERATIHDQFYQKQSLAAPSVQSGQGGDNCLTNLDEEDEADLEAQLLLMGGGVRHATSTTRPEVSKRVQEVENRQKIFEDEIIKRIKEIQRYTKSIHLQVKKQSQAHSELEEFHDRLEKRSQQLESNTNLGSVQQPDVSDVQSQLDDMRDSYLPQICTELTNQLKQEMSHKISQEVRQQVDRANKNHPPVDTLKLQETIMTRVQDCIDDAIDSSQAMVQVEDLKHRLQSLQSISAQKDKDLKQLHLKVDKIDLRLDSYHDMLSQQDQTQDNNAEQLCSSLRQELSQSLEELDTKLSLKFTQSNKSSGVKMTEVDRRLVEHQKMLQELSQLHQEESMGDRVTERLDDLELKIEQDFKKLHSETQTAIHNQDTQAQSRLKRSQGQVTTQCNSVQDKLLTLQQEVQELVNEVDLKLQKKFDSLQVTVDKQQFGIDKQAKQMSQSVAQLVEKEVNRVMVNFVDDESMREIVEQLEAQIAQQADSHHIAIKQVSAPEVGNSNNQTNSDGELQEKIQQLEVKLNHSIKELSEQIQSESSNEIHNLAQDLTSQLSHQKEACMAKTEEVASNLLALSQRVGQNNQKYITEDKWDKGIAEVEQRLEDSQAYGLERAQDEVSSKLDKMEKSVKALLSTAQEQNQELVTKNSKTSEAQQKQINAFSTDLKNKIEEVSQRVTKLQQAPSAASFSPTESTSTARFEELHMSTTTKLQSVQATLDRHEQLTKGHTTQFDQHFQSLADLASLVSRLQQEQAQSQLQLPLQTTQILGIENIQMQLDDQSETIFELQQSLQKVKKAMPVEEVKKSGSFLSQASEKQVQENVLREVQQQIDQVDERINELESRLEESIQQDNGVDALSQRVNQLTEQVRGIPPPISGVTREELDQVLNQVEQGDERAFAYVDQQIAEVQAQVDSVEIRLKEDLTAKQAQGITSVQHSIQLLEQDLQSLSEQQQSPGDDKEISHLTTQLKEQNKQFKAQLDQQDENLNQRLASAVQHSERQSQSNAGDIQACKQALECLETVIMQLSQSFAKVSGQYSAQSLVTDDLYDLVQKLDDKMVKCRDDMIGGKLEIGSLRAEFGQSGKHAMAQIASIVEEIGQMKVAGVRVKKEPEPVHVILREEPARVSVMEEPIRVTASVAPVQEEQIVSAVLKIDESLPKIDSTQVRSLPAETQEELGATEQRKETDSEEEAVEEESEEEERYSDDEFDAKDVDNTFDANKMLDNPHMVKVDDVVFDMEDDDADVTPDVIAHKVIHVLHEEEQEHSSPHIDQPASPAKVHQEDQEEEEDVEEEEEEEVQVRKPSDTITQPAIVVSQDILQDEYYSDEASVEQAQESGRDSDLLSLNPSSQVEEVKQLSSPPRREQSVSDQGSDHIAVPRSMEKKEPLWDSYLVNMKDLQDTDSQAILPEEEEEGCSQEGSLRLDERPSLGGILDSGNFYNSDLDQNSAVKEVLQDQLEDYEEDSNSEQEDKLDHQIEISSAKVQMQIEQQQHLDYDDEEELEDQDAQETQAIESFIMSEILEAWSLHISNSHN